MKRTGIIIGGGAVGVDFHLPRITNICNINHTTIVEPDKNRLEQLKIKLSGYNTKLLSKLNSDNVKYHIAVIATPPKFHLEYVNLLADRCEKLIIEKPIARTSVEAESIVEKIEKSNCIAFVCHIRRSLQSFSQIKSIIRSNIFGKLQSVDVYEGSVFNWRVASIGSFSRELNGGGVLMDTGPHVLDLMFQVFDELEVKSSKIDADLKSSHKTIEANCYMELETNTGVPVNISLSRNRHLSNKAYFTFEKVSVSVDLRDNTLDFDFGDGCRFFATPKQYAGHSMNFGDLFDTIYKNFISPGTNKGISPENSLPIMKVIDQTYAKASIIEEKF